MEDDTKRLLDNFTAHKKAKTLLPALEVLKDYINQPLPDDMKILVTQNEFDSFLSNDMRDYCSKEQLEALFKVSESKTSSRLLMEVVGKIVYGNPPPANSTETAYITFWDENIRAPIKFFYGNDENGESIRDSNKHMSTLSQRPDYGYILQEVCPFRGEEKSATSTEDPRAELRDKLDWTYESTPYILGMTSYS